jgi:hypothetical protein
MLPSSLELLQLKSYTGWMSVEELVMQLPRAEKLRLMEALWANLSDSDEAFDSPDWHEHVLRETDERVRSGSEPILDWEEAKRRLKH